MQNNAMGETTMKSWIVVGVLALCAGCVSVQLTSSAPTTRSEVVQEKNYQLGQPRSIVVGEQLIRVKDYQVTVRESVAYKAERPISIEGGPVRIDLTEGQILRVLGQRVVGQQNFTVLGLNRFGIQVFPDGRIHNKVINGYGFGTSAVVEMVYTFNISPAGASLVPVNEQSIRREAFRQNYEIVFNGIDGSAMRFQYREYSPDDLARPAFSQELSYPVTSSTIRFRNLQIRVIGVNAERIEYEVVNDTPSSG